MSFASSDVYVGGESSNSSSESIQPSSAENYLKLADNVNKSNKVKVDDDSGSSPSAKTSIANANLGVGVSVTNQTGQLSINLGGVLGLNNGTPDYDPVNGKLIYYIPNGWGTSIPYIAEYPCSSQINRMFSSGSSLILNNDYHNADNFYSGFLDNSSETSQIYAGDLTELTLKNKITGISSTITYKWVLNNFNGNKTYFGPNGKLLCQEDSFGNFTLYNYTTDNAPYASQLKSITSPDGEVTAISYPILNSSETELQATAPDGEYIKYDFKYPSPTEHIITVTDTSGRSVVITEHFNSYGESGNHYVTIVYPSGTSAKYTYSAVIKCQTSSSSPMQYLDAITKVENYSDPSMQNLTSTTTYSYDNYNDNNFTGYGLTNCFYSPTVNALMESDGGSSYRYGTTITTTYPDSQNSYSTTFEYDNQQLLLESDSYVNGSISQKMIYHYEGQDSSGNFPYIQNESPTYNLPSEVDTISYNNSSSGDLLSQTSAVTYSYNNLGQPTEAQFYPNCTYNGSTVTLPASPSITKSMGYASKYSIGAENIATYTGCGLLKSENVTDNITGKVITVDNILSPDKNYVTESTTTEDGDSTTAYTLCDSMGRVIKTSSSSPQYPDEGTKATYSYTISGNDITTTQTDYINGKKTSTPITSTNVYDIRNGNIISSTDNMGNTVKYTYSNNDLTVTKTLYDAKGNEQGSSTVDDSIINQESSSNSDGSMSLIVSDPISNTVKSYDNMTSSGYGNTCSRLVGTNTYNNSGELVSSTDMLGHTTTYTYDPQGRVLTTTDWQGNTESQSYYYTAFTEENGTQVTAANDFDNFNGINISGSWYGPSGNLLASVNYPDNNSSAYSYDGFGALTGTFTYNTDAVPQGSSVTPILSSSSTYNLFGRNSYTMNAQSTTQSQGNFNAASTWTKDMYGDKTQRTTTYNNLCAGIAPQTSPIKGELSTYNSLGEMTSLTDQAGNTLNYTYTPFGALSSTTDYNGNKYDYTYAYIAGSWVISNLTITTPDGKTITEAYTYYDSDYTAADYGDLDTVTLTRADGTTSTNSYTYYPSGTPYAGSVETVTKNGKTMTYNYELLSDVSPDAQCGNTVPLLSSVTDYAGVTTSYTYYSDAPYARVKEISNPYGTITYQYFGKTTDSSAGIVATTNPLLWSGTVPEEEDYGNGMSVKYQYYNTTKPSSSNNAAELQSVTTYNPLNQVVNSSIYTYSEGKIATEQDSSAIDQSSDSNNTKTYTYNAIGELIEVSVSDSKGNVVSKTDYVYDVSGNIVSKTVTPGEGGVGSVDTYTHTYNSINQLVNMTNTETLSGKTTVLENNTYAYDANGNMISVTNNLTTPASTIYTMQYNALNQMTELNNSSNSVNMSYTYGADGSRFSKYITGNTGEELNYYGDNAFNTKNGNVSTYLGGAVRTVLSSPVLSVKSPTVVESQYLVSNSKSVVAATDSKGNITNKYDYTAYGMSTSYGELPSVFNAKNLITTPDLLSLTDNPHQYDGYYNDEGTGLYYDNARYYMPEIGMFTSKDSYDLPNRYAYCGGDPVDNIDPSGHNWFNRADNDSSNYFISGLCDLLKTIFGAVTNNPYLVEDGIGDAQKSYQQVRQDMKNYVDHVPDPENGEDTTIDCVNLCINIFVAGWSAGAEGLLGEDEAGADLGGAEAANIADNASTMNNPGGDIGNMNDFENLAMDKDTKVNYNMKVQQSLPESSFGNDGCCCCTKSNSLANEVVIKKIPDGNFDSYSDRALSFKINELNEKIMAIKKSNMRSIYADVDLSEQEIDEKVKMVEFNKEATKKLETDTAKVSKKFKNIEWNEENLKTTFPYENKGIYPANFFQKNGEVGLGDYVQPGEEEVSNVSYVTGKMKDACNDFGNMDMYDALHKNLLNKYGTYGELADTFKIMEENNNLNTYLNCTLNIIS